MAGGHVPPRCTNHDLLMARANSSGEVGLRTRANKPLEYEELMSSEEECKESDGKQALNEKNVSSKASCSKRAKRPRVGKAVPEECEGSDGDISV